MRLDFAARYSTLPLKWGLSSAGRAPHWQCGGQRFDPARLHHPTKACKMFILQAFLFTMDYCLSVMRTEVESAMQEQTANIDETRVRMLYERAYS